MYKFNLITGIAPFFKTIFKTLDKEFPDNLNIIFTQRQKKWMYIIFTKYNSIMHASKIKSLFISGIVTLKIIKYIFFKKIDHKGTFLLQRYDSQYSFLSTLSYFAISKVNKKRYFEILFSLFLLFSVSFFLWLSFNH